jgi:hypothetical protein
MKASAVFIYDLYDRKTINRSPTRTGRCEQNANAYQYCASSQPRFPNRRLELHLGRLLHNACTGSSLHISYLIKRPALYILDLWTSSQPNLFPSVIEICKPVSTTVVSSSTGRAQSSREEVTSFDASRFLCHDIPLLFGCGHRGIGIDWFVILVRR